MPLGWALAAAAVLGLGALVVLSEDAEASHYRYGKLEWVRPDTGSTTVLIQGEFAFRTTFYPDMAVACWNAFVGFPSYPLPDCLKEWVIDQGELDFGDGSVPIQVTLVPFSVDPVDDWVRARMVGDDGQLVLHQYPGDGPYTARYTKCCRLNAYQPYPYLDPYGVNSHLYTNFHHNNPSQDFALETTVSLGGSSLGSPVIEVPPIVYCDYLKECEFPVNGLDPDGDPVTFRFSTPAESGSPAFEQPDGAQIDGDDGTYTWWATQTLQSDPNAVRSVNLWSTTVTVEDHDSKSSVDFFLAVCQDVMDAWLGDLLPPGTWPRA